MKRLVLLLMLLAGCAGAPEVAARNPWFNAPTDLAAKEKTLSAHTETMIDNGGMFCYRSYMPWSKPVNYVDSHDVADFPAWQGYYMIALTFKEAVSGEDTDDLLYKLAEGLSNCFEVTGVEGLLARSFIFDYTGPRRAWMETKELRPTKYWMQNSKGQWWRNGLAKSHWNRTIVGCSVPLALHRSGDISLSTKTEGKLKDILLKLVRKMHSDGYRIRDWNGEFTEFGDLRPDVSFGSDWPELGLPNGFNRMVIANALKSAGAYDNRLNHVYEDSIKEWHDGIGTSMEATGEVIHAIGHWKLDKPSYGDMGSFSLATLSFLLQEDNREYTKSVSRAMNGLWQFMRYERNPVFTFTYTGLVRKADGQRRLPPIIQDLRDFPDVEHKKRSTGGKKKTDKVQPLANRAVNSIYWKSSPFKKVIHPQVVMKHPETNDEYVYSGVDYMLAYWMGRFFGLVPER